MDKFGDHLPKTSGTGERSFSASLDARLPSGMVTFLLTDVEGSARLWEAAEDVAPAAIARHYELLDAAITLHGGVRPVEQGEGDSVVGAFAKASEALSAALDIQRAFAEEHWPGGRTLRVRVALHTGEANLREEGNYFGPTIIRCARLRQITHGGQTLLSGVTHDLVAEYAPDGVTFRDLGTHRLKDLGRPERVWQMCHPDLEIDFPPIRSLDVIPNNLPLQLTSFVGRATELDELRRVLESWRLVTLTGSGGCGKTRLALQVAAELVDQCADGAWWVDLSAVNHRDRVASAVARVLGLREEEGRPLIDTLAKQLAPLELLLVLDNCEHLLDACAPIVESLLRAAPRLRMVATSREPLGAPGEQVWRVPSLDEETAARLFVERASQVRPGFAPGPSEKETVREICHRLDGIPLPIELAASRVRMMHPARIAAALDDRFRLLTGGGRTAIPRQQTLEASVAWSYDLLDDYERALLRRLSVFAGGFTLEAAEHVCGTDPLDEYAVLDLLTRLVDKSLVQVEHIAADEDRYRLLETIRIYAGQRLIEAGEADATRDRHATFFLEMVERAEPELAVADGPVWLSRLERDHANLRAALDWMDATRAHGPFLRLVTALTLFWEMRGHLAEGGRWFARALAHDDGPSSVRARALWGATHVAMYGDDFETAARRGPEALAMAEVAEDEWATARALNVLGYMQLFTDPESARAGLERSIELGRKIGDNWAVADGLKMITVAWLMQENHSEILRTAEELRRVAADLDNKFFLAWYHCVLGWTAVRRGELKAARQELHTSLSYCREVGEPVTAGVASFLLAEAELLTGNYQEGEEQLQTFLSRAGATGGATAVPFAYLALGTIWLARGELERARNLLKPLVEQMRAFDLPLFVSWGLCVVGAGLLTAGEYRLASSALQEATDQAGRLNNQWLLALAKFHAGQLARRRDDSHTAEDLHHEALAHRLQEGFNPGLADSLEALATIAADHESFAEAARLFGAASALRRALRLARWPVEEAEYDAKISQTRGALGDSAFEAAWAEGEQLGVEEAAGYATRARGERKRPSLGWESLTPTEVQVVKLLSKGLTNPQIGERLFISRGTVKTHLAHVFSKLGVTSRAELAAEATRHGV